MQKHYEPPGTSAWNARRAACFNAGDAPAMLGASGNKTRSQLLQELHSGLPREFTDFVQERVIDPGHRVEALMRPLAEDIMGEDMAVFGGSLPVSGLSRPLGASFDGVPFMIDMLWECKTINEELRAALPHEGRDSHEHNDATKLPKAYRVQLEQQLLVSETATRTLFSAGRFDEYDEVAEERHCWYFPDPALRAEIIAGWKQFDADLAAYVPQEAVVEAVGRTPETLPALHIVLRGEVSASNLAEFKDVALTAIRSVNRTLKTDQDFADSAKARKWCDDIESRVAAAKDHALSQTASIDLLFRTMDEISGEARDVRLELEKLEKVRKEARKGEIVASGFKALGDHVAALNARLGKNFMPSLQADLGGVIKGMRSFDSMQNAVDTAVANAKITASATADRIQGNLGYLAEDVPQGHAFLFADLQALVLKPADDFRAIVDNRIAAHKAKREQEEAAQRERIRSEELQRIEREQRAEDALIASIWANARRIEFDSVPYIRKAIAHFESGGSFEADQRPRVVEAFASARKEMKAKLEAAELREQAASEEARATVQMAAAAAPLAAAPVPVAAVARPVGKPVENAPAADSPPTLTLGQIGTRLGFSLSADFIRTLGFEPVKVKAACMFHEDDWTAICAALITHIGSRIQQAETV